MPWGKAKKINQFHPFRWVWNRPFNSSVFTKTENTTSDTNIITKALQYPRSNAVTARPLTRPSETLAREWLNTKERQEMVMSTITLMNTIYNLSEKSHIDWDCDMCYVFYRLLPCWLTLESWFTCLGNKRYWIVVNNKRLISWSRLNWPIRSITRV